MSFSTSGRFCYSTTALTPCYYIPGFHSISPITPRHYSTGALFFGPRPSFLPSSTSSPSLASFLLFCHLVAFTRNYNEGAHTHHLFSAAFLLSLSAWVAGVFCLPHLLHNNRSCFAASSIGLGSPYFSASPVMALCFAGALFCWATYFLHLRRLLSVPLHFDRCCCWFGASATSSAAYFYYLPSLRCWPPCSVPFLVRSTPCCAGVSSLPLPSFPSLRVRYSLLRAWTSPPGPPVLPFSSSTGLHSPRFGSLLPAPVGVSLLRVPLLRPYGSSVAFGCISPCGPY